MKRYSLFVIVSLLCTTVAFTQKVDVFTSSYDTKETELLVTNLNYPAHVIEKGLEKYMQMQGQTLSFMPLKYKAYKNVTLRNLSVNESPYRLFQFLFKTYEDKSNPTGFTNTLTLTILDNNGNLLNFKKYPNILEEGKKWMEDFLLYFEKTYLLERDVLLKRKEIVSLIRRTQKMEHDSLPTFRGIENKILFHENEVRLLQQSLENQKVIFKNSILSNYKTIDSLNLVVDGLENQLSK